MACCAGQGPRGSWLCCCHGDLGPLPLDPCPHVLCHESAPIAPGPQSWPLGAIPERGGQRVLGPGRWGGGSAGFPRTPSDQGPYLPGWPGSTPARSPLRVQASGSARLGVIGFPHVCGRSGSDIDSWCHKLLCLIWLPCDGRQQLREGERGGRGARGPLRRAGRRACWLCGPPARGQVLSKCEDVSVQPA